MSLSNPSQLKKHVQELAEYRFDYYTVSNGFNTISYNDRNPETGDYEDGIFDVDDDLMKLANRFILNPQQRVFPYLESGDQIERLLAVTRYSLRSIEEEVFYEPFTKYRNSVIRIGNLLKKFKDYRGRPFKKKREGERGIKTERAYELKPILDEIIRIGDHQEAIAYLEEKVTDFSWDDPHKELFTQKGKVVKTQVAKALYQIGLIKWEIDYPGEQTIRSALLKDRKV